MTDSIFLHNLNKFFRHPAKHDLQEKIVFAVGTGPMRKGRSEIEEILYATDFEKAYLVDPVYGVAGGAVDIDIEEIAHIDVRFMINNLRTGERKIHFGYEGKKREIIFVAGDGTIPENIPDDFTIFFSGRRIGMYPGFGLRGTPSQYLDVIVKRLPLGGYVVPDRDLTDDKDYFFIPPSELGLEEVKGIRSEGMGLYKKTNNIDYLIKD